MVYFLLFLIIIAGFWSYFIEPNIIKLEEVELELKKELNLDLKEVKFVQLSDLHSKRFGKREKKILGILKNLKPNFIFITGDIVDWTTKNFQSCQQFWRELVRITPNRAFAVLGNHEHKNPGFKTVFLEDSGIEVLNNQSKKISFSTSHFYLVGVDDPHLGYDDIEKALVGVGDNDLKILLAHSPEIFRKVRRKNIDLILTGHTHGGQIDIPFLSRLILPLKYDKKYKKGLYKEKESYLYVNRGLGTTIFPLRFNSLPEIALIKLKFK